MMYFALFGATAAAAAACRVERHGGRRKSAQSIGRRRRQLKVLLAEGSVGAAAVNTWIANRDRVLESGLIHGRHGCGRRRAILVAALRRQAVRLGARRRRRLSISAAAAAAVGSGRGRMVNIRGAISGVGEFLSSVRVCLRAEMVKGEEGRKILLSLVGLILARAGEPSPARAAAAIGARAGPCNANLSRELEVRVGPLLTGRLSVCLSR